MAVLQSAVFKFSSYCRTLNTSRFSTSCLLNKQTLEEKYGIAPRPKKPITPFFKFLANVRSELMQENPKIKTTEISKVAGNRWSKIGDQAKTELKKEYEVEFQKYQEIVKEYEMKVNPDIRDKILMEKEHIKQRKEQIQFKKRREELGRPKKPPSSFMLFMKSKVSERGDYAYQDWLARVSKEWKSLSVQDREPYVDKRNKELLEYNKRLAEWEEDMIQQGLSSVLKKHPQDKPKKNESSREK